MEFYYISLKEQYGKRDCIITSYFSLIFENFAIICTNYTLKSVNSIYNTIYW